jgi:hypothetical protein
MSSTNGDFHPTFQTMSRSVTERQNHDGITEINQAKLCADREPFTRSDQVVMCAGSPLNTIVTLL